MTTYTGPATLSWAEIETGGIARIYLTEPRRWEGTFFRGDSDVLSKMFGETVTLMLEDGEMGSVLVQSHSVGSDEVALTGTGPWPLA